MLTATLEVKVYVALGVGLSFSLCHKHLIYCDTHDFVEV